MASLKQMGITTLLTTQYLEEADALSDRIIVIDHGKVIAEGTADELKARTGGSYCEVVPLRMEQIPAIVAALGSLLPDDARAALTADADRSPSPPPTAPARSRRRCGGLDAAGVDLVDIALRRPSLDDVFLSLTGHVGGGGMTGGVADSAPAVIQQARPRRDLGGGSRGETVPAGAVVGAEPSADRADVPQRRDRDVDTGAGGVHRSASSCR